jgi:hypothetical protein
MPRISFGTVHGRRIEQQGEGKRTRGEALVGRWQQCLLDPGIEEIIKPGLSTLSVLSTMNDPLSVLILCPLGGSYSVVCVLATLLGLFWLLPWHVSLGQDSCRGGT